MRFLAQSAVKSPAAIRRLRRGSATDRIEMNGEITDEHCNCNPTGRDGK